MERQHKAGRLPTTNPFDEESSDAEAIASVLDGDIDRFEILVQRYHPAMLRTAIMRIGDRQAAEDVVQDSLLAAFRGLKSYDSNYSFRTWLWAILVNESRRKYARMKKSVATVADDAAIEGVARNPDEQSLAAEQLKRIMHLLDRLPEKQAQAIRLRFAGELKYREMAQLLDCSLATAKNRVRSGLLTLGNLVQAEDQVAKDHS